MDVEDMWYDGGGRQGNWVEIAAEKHGGGDVGQQGQRKHIYGKMDTETEETRYGRQKRCGTMWIAFFSTVGKVYEATATSADPGTNIWGGGYE